MNDSLKITDGPLLMNRKIDVLDKGFVRLVDSMGDDLSVVQIGRAHV